MATFSDPPRTDRRLASRRRPAAQALPAAARHHHLPAACDGEGVARREFTSPADARAFPRRDRIALPGALAPARARRVEVQQPRLRAGIELELQRRRVLPRDAQAARLAHDAAHSERLALQGSGVVLGQIPCLGGLAALGVDRDAGHIALRWRDHAPPVVLGDDRHPVAGQVDGRQLPAPCAGAGGAPRPRPAP